jgi:divalent metal cation (Fe/Co/Zn/Cd) transporter
MVTEPHSDGEWPGVTALLGVVINALTGVWWVEYLAALALLFWLVREAREALEASRERRVHDDE